MTLTQPDSGFSIVKIRIEDSPSQDVREITGNLSNEFKDVLVRFAQYAKELGECEYIQSPKQATFNFKWEVGKGHSSNPTLPEMSVCDSFIYRLRPFVLNDESTNYLRVLKQTGKMLQDPTVHKMMKDLRHYWDGRKIRELFTLSDETGVLNNDAMTMKYLHAFEYHRNQEKAAKFKSLQEMFGTDGLRAFYLLLLADKAKAIFQLSYLIEVILGTRSHSKIRYGGESSNT